MPLPTGTLDWVFQQVLLAARKVWRWINRHPVLVFGALLALALVGSYYPLIRPYFYRRVVVYTTGKPSDSYAFYELIKDKFRPQDTPWFVTYKFEPHVTGGFHDNRDEVRGSRPGDLVLGFDQDGFGPPAEVRTLLPLSKMHLHVFARSGDVDAVEKAGRWPGWAPFAPARKPPTLRDLIAWKKLDPANPKLKYYSGPRGSGSRQVAELVLKYYYPATESMYLEADEHIGRRDAYRMLRDKQLDVVFDIKELGSEHVVEVARQGGFTLVGLDDVAGLAVTGRNSLSAEKIPRGAYAHGNGFCRADLDTVGVQWLIICPQSMPASDAYYLTDGIREALREKVPVVPWDKQDVARDAAPGLTYALHPGTLDYRQGRPPWLVRVLSDYWYLALTTGAGFLIYVLQRQANVLPTVAGLPAEVVTAVNTPSAPVRFTVEDPETPAGRLRVTAAADNKELIPDAGIVVAAGAAAAERTIVLTPAADRDGATRVTVTVVDEKGGTGTAGFDVRVVRPSPPAVTAQASVNGSMNGAANGVPGPHAPPPAAPPEGPAAPEPIRQLWADVEFVRHGLHWAEAPLSRADADWWRKRVKAVRRDLDALPARVREGFADQVARLRAEADRLAADLDRLLAARPAAGPAG